MIPKPPPRDPALGFLYLPPFRVQGMGIAGEATSIQVPELDVCFDMGQCYRPALAMKYAVLSHGHMDHIGGLSYWCSQRNFQGMGPGTIVCDARMAPAIEKMMEGFVELERQRTPYELVRIEPGGEVEIKNNIVLRAFETDHTVESMGYVIVEKRSKLREELLGLPQEKLREMKERGEEITRVLEVPLITYTGDTAPGPHLVRDDVLKSQIVIAECTFVEPDHRDRAKIGKHLHAADIAEWVRVLRCDWLVLTHLSRRTHLGQARKRLTELIGPERMQTIELLMDHRRNKSRYEKQAEEAEQKAAT